jgi:aspartate racemase
LLLEGVDSPLALIDSAEEHVAMGLEWVLGEEE